MNKNYDNEHIKEIACKFLDYYRMGYYTTNKPEPREETKQDNN